VRNESAKKEVLKYESVSKQAFFSNTRQTHMFTKIEATQNNVFRQICRLYVWNIFSHFYARQLYRQVLLTARISYGNYSVRLSVRLSRSGTDSRPGEIETPGLHRMIA